MGHKDVVRNGSTTTPSTHDYVETVSFIDGFDRVIQTKKDLERDTGASTQIGMIVSGHVVFDERRRLQAQGQPIFTTDAANVLVDVPTRDPGSVERSTSWTYDVLGRVVKVRTPSDVEDVGTNFVNIATTYGSTHPHAVSRMPEQWPAESSRYNRDFTYDGSGNQTKSVYRGSDTREITWNEDDQPITIAFNTQVRSKNLYDGEGQRAVSQHLVSALEETAYVSPDLTIRDGKYLTKHVYAGTTQLASKVDSAWLNYPPTLYFHTDQLNSTQYASMDDQTLIQHDEYFPSGELWRDETDSRYELARRHTFTGKELDIGTGPLLLRSALLRRPHLGSSRSPPVQRCQKAKSASSSLLDACRRTRWSQSRTNVRSIGGLDSRPRFYGHLSASRTTRGQETSDLPVRASRGH